MDDSIPNVNQPNVNAEPIDSLRQQFFGTQTAQENIDMNRETTPQPPLAHDGATNPPHREDVPTEDVPTTVAGMSAARHYFGRPLDPAEAGDDINVPVRPLRFTEESPKQSPPPETTDQATVPPERHWEATTVKEDEEALNNPENRPAPMNADDWQEARWASYNSISGATVRDFWKETTEAIVPTVITNLLDTSIDAVSHGASRMVPANVRAAATATSQAISHGADKVGDVIEAMPLVVMKIIPDKVLSKEHKQLLFADFSNTMRSFFHTNVLSMPFVLREAGLVSGIMLMMFVAFTSEYATEAYFGAKNQMRDADKVVLYGDVPRMIWGDWYPMLNMFYGVSHLIGFLAFTSSNSKVMLAAMGLTGGGATAVSLIVPSVIALPLVFMKRDRHQQPLAILSNTLVLTSAIMMLAYFPYGKNKDIPLWPSSPSNFFTALGVTVYAFTGIGSCIPIERSMPPRRYVVMLRIAICITFALLLAFGLCGYLSYGTATCSVMTVSLQTGKMKTAVSSVLFVASLAIIPQQTFPLCELCDRRLLGYRRITKYWEWQPNVLRMFMLAACAFAAWIVPYYGLMLSISGAFGCGIVGIVVPAALDYVRRRRWGLCEGRHLHWWEYIVTFGLGGYGCAVVVIGVSFGLYNMWITIQTNSHSNC